MSGPIYIYDDAQLREVYKAIGAYLGKPEIGNLLVKVTRLELRLSSLELRLSKIAAKSKRRRTAIKQLQKALALEQAINRERAEENRRLREQIAQNAKAKASGSVI